MKKYKIPKIVKKLETSKNKKKEIEANKKSKNQTKNKNKNKTETNKLPQLTPATQATLAKTLFRNEPGSPDILSGITALKKLKQGISKDVSRQADEEVFNQEVSGELDTAFTGDEGSDESESTEDEIEDATSSSKRCDEASATGSESGSGSEQVFSDEVLEETYSKDFCRVSSSNGGNGKSNYKNNNCRAPGTATSLDYDIVVDEDGFTHSKEAPGNFSYIFCNARGFNSKRASFEAILSSSDIDVLCISETHLYFNKNPRINGYSFISRSRAKVNSKGGVCIGVKKELEKFVVKLFEGEGSNECLIIKITCFNPAVVIGVYYGNQENTTSHDTIKGNLSEFFDQLNRYRDQGLDVIAGGDFNLHVGLAVKDNEPAVSKGGSFFVDMCNELGFEIINNRGQGDSHTHFDRSSGTSRVLDMVISNVGDQHTVFKVDNEKKLTPYRFKTGREGLERVYTDHLTLYGELKVDRTKASKQKIKIWRLDAPGGKVRYQILTDQHAEEATRIILESPNSDVMMLELNKLLKKIKLQAYGVRTITHKRFERESDERLATKRLIELERAKHEMDLQRKKVHEQVFITRKKLSNDQDNFTEALNHFKTGERLEDIDDIKASVLEYNVEVLKKNECKTEEAQERRDFKAETVDFYENIHDEESEKDISWDEFMKVVTQVHSLNKTCYRDFSLAGPKWQTAMYLMFRRIYSTEDIPEEFMQTKLKQLYKRKGDKSKLASYRFIHLKDWAGKMMEKLVMLKCQEKVTSIMPDMQIGGMKNSSTVEHILSLLTVANIKAKENTGLIIMFFDCMKCFDKQLLTDTLYSAATAGVKGKPLKVMRRLHDNTVISLVGDDSGRCAVIANSTGQGTNWAPAACSLSMGQAIKEQSDYMSKNKIRIGDMSIDPLMYVDDAAIMADTVQGAIDGGILMTKALNELGLEAHPDKSAMVIMGPKKFKDKIREDLKKSPVLVQGWELKESEAETYLGVEISGKGVKDSVMRSIKKRCRAAVAKEIQLSKILDSDMIEKVGWLESVKTLFNSVIISTLTYGTQAYVYMNKTQVAEVESCMKEVLYRMLKLSKFANYAAVLLECNMIRIKHIINQLKLGFVHDLIHVKGKGLCFEILKKEEELFPGTGLLAEAAELSEMYELNNVVTNKTEKELIKENVWEFGREEIWQETLRSSKVPYNDTHHKRHRMYTTLPKFEAKLYFAFKIGELQFKENRRGEYRAKFGDTLCFVPGCNQPDTLEHVQRCRGYTRCKIPELGEWEDLDSIKKAIEYLTYLDWHRSFYYKLPLIHRPGLKEAANR